MSKKVKLSKKTRTEWKSAMAKLQNKVKMLNGGQLEEAQTIAFGGLLMISAEAQAEIMSAVVLAKKSV